MLKKKMTNPPEAVALSEMEAKPYIDQLQGTVSEITLKMVNFCLIWKYDISILMGFKFQNWHCFDLANF